MDSLPSPCPRPKIIVKREYQVLSRLCEGLWEHSDGWMGRAQKAYGRRGHMALFELHVPRQGVEELGLLSSCSAPPPHHHNLWNERLCSCTKPPSLATVREAPGCKVGRKARGHTSSCSPVPAWAGAGGLLLRAERGSGKSWPWVGQTDLPAINQRRDHGQVT